MSLQLSKCLKPFGIVETLFKIFHIVFGTFAIVLVFVAKIIASCAPSMIIQLFCGIKSHHGNMHCNASRYIIGFTNGIKITFLFNITLENSKKF